MGKKVVVIRKAEVGMTGVFVQFIFNFKEKGKKLDLYLKEIIPLELAEIYKSVGSDEIKEKIEQIIKHLSHEALEVDRNDREEKLVFFLPKNKKIIKKFTRLAEQLFEELFRWLENEDKKKEIN